MKETLFEAINTYQPPEEVIKYVSENPSCNIAGPTGAGKGTFSLYLAQSREFAPVVSDTTRIPRPHNDGLEVNGVQYWFIKEDEAELKVRDGKYIEVKAVHHKTMYGTSFEAYKKVVESGRVPILEIDVQGMEDLMDRYPDFESIFLLPPDFDIWQVRLDGRGDMNLDEKIHRFKTALVEMKKPFENPRFHPVINTEVVETEKIIESGEHKTPEYRARALKVASELLTRTAAFLEEYDRAA